MVNGKMENKGEAKTVQKTDFVVVVDFPCSIAKGTGIWIRVLMSLRNKKKTVRVLAHLDPCSACDLI